MSAPGTERHSPPVSAMGSASAVADRVQSALDRALELGEIGMQVAVYLHGELLIDAAAGSTAPGGGPVDTETLFPVLSVSKAITATAVHLQAERGLLDYHRPVADYWPRFAANGKEQITVAHVLAHQSGIPQMPAGVTPETMCNWDWMVAEIEQLIPHFPPGTANAYQSINYGWLLGELVRRTDRLARPFGRFVREELCEPCGVGDLWMGLPAEQDHRMAALVSPRPEQPENETSLSRAAKPPGVDIGPPLYNRTEIWRACLPGTGAIMNARSGARLFALLANGGELNGNRLLSPDRIRSFTTLRSHSDKPDLVILGGGRVSPPIGVGGYWLSGSPMGGGPGVLSHGGGSTSSIFVDIDKGLSVAISQNRCFAPTLPGAEQPFNALASAIHEIVEASTGHGRS
jgi:CubicO group peptidase (beta-lactamase class C family)